MWRNATCNVAAYSHLFVTKNRNTYEKERERERGRE